MAVTVVGIGDDGPAGLGERARAAIDDAELLVGGRRHLAFYAAHPAAKLTITDNVEEVASRLAAEPSRRRCVVLASGDPCFFGIGPLLAERLGRERVEIIPQASSVALAFARLGLSWQDAIVLSAHGRSLAKVLSQAVGARKLAFLTDDGNTPATIATALLAAGRPDGPAYVLEHVGGEAERVVETRLAELPGQSFDRLNILVLLSDKPAAVADPETPRRTLPGIFGRSEDEFGQARGQITKAEVRAVALAKLELPSDGVLWDVGAGSGSISIEAAGLMPGGTIYAVECAADQLNCLRDNIRRHGARQVRPVDGKAPDALRELPHPDRVFVGGGGAALAAIIQASLERLRGRGRLVANVATLESALEAQEAVRAAGWQSELVQVGVARGRLIGWRTRLEALNPVFIVSARPVREGDAETGGEGDARP